MKVIKLLDDKLEEILLIVLLVAMACIMGIQVFCRYVLNFSLSWSEELTRYMFIWSCFISISYCIKRWISIKVDQVINMFPKKAYVFAQLFFKYIVICTLLLFEYSWIQIFDVINCLKTDKPCFTTSNAIRSMCAICWICFGHNTFFSTNYM